MPKKTVQRLSRLAVPGEEKGRSGAMFAKQRFHESWLNLIGIVLPEPSCFCDQDFPAGPRA
jgi:hypothetical protein